MKIIKYLCYLFILILVVNCKTKTEKNESIIYVYDSIKSGNYFEKGFKHYDNYTFSENLKVLDSSIYYLKKSIAYNRENIGSYQLLITVLNLKNDFEGIEKVINDALKYTNQTAYYTAAKGSIKNKLNQNDSAQFYFSLALKKYYNKEQNLGIKNQIITILYEMGNKEESLKVIDECLKEYPSDSLILNMYKKMIINDQIER
ncbi:hypothetical protein SAMN05444411_1462 [Lutibacter oricola]|uniref:Tetratricopeptide repeat-containing protein n=1 Tax=Lutibacter oricola TaxID=762486 RepID=A0A1H3HM28_9FLAO|nr:hypothetical protein [Lutibacter oricola]SDY16527.1 hypothetical protein SAMN05444411_1462 [Lutibacter oricola]